MSCPDPTPEPGSVQDLEYQLAEAKRRLVRKKNDEYLSGPKFVEDIAKMRQLVPKPYREEKPDAVEDIIELFLKEFSRVNAALSEEQWKPRKGRC